MNTNTPKDETPENDSSTTDQYDWINEGVLLTLKTRGCLASISSLNREIKRRTSRNYWTFSVLDIVLASQKSASEVRAAIRAGELKPYDISNLAEWVLQARYEAEKAKRAHQGVEMEYGGRTFRFKVSPPEPSEDG